MNYTPSVIPEYIVPLALTIHMPPRLTLFLKHATSMQNIATLGPSYSPLFVVRWMLAVYGCRQSEPAAQARKCLADAT